ncbi:hypothetical protein [Reyranella sp. CPCC 100927]|uniref:hypothetical protein n=1 Tax=Reyranella sp. CPCC 100927 TaxID=2599616 RepID=UPI0011B543B2|nr:hypothetical protein [Reyranella sp. CPCC 100927]TWT15623.1 hypothetical protein FQU96_04545 [Reyranella sp. CPCC 100927]
MLVVGILGIVAAFVASVALPLATYTTVLALFGFAHVASELRYVDHRFGDRLDGGLAGTLALLLGIAVVLRLAGLQGWVAAPLAVGLEVGLGAILLAVTVARMRRRRWIAVIAALVLMAGALLAPFETLLCLAIGHNLTPLGFLAEVLRGAARRRALALGALAFIVLPLLIATGLPFAGFAALGLVAPEATLFQAGNLTRNLGAYVPASALYSDWALHAFAASVFAQCMHYIAVIAILPRLIDTASRPRLVWPDAARFGRYLVVGGAALAVGFALDYGVQRQLYALAALVHAWLELPVFALALGGAAAAQASPNA